MPVAQWQKKTGIQFNLPAACNINTVNPAHWNFTHQPEKLANLSLFQ